MDNYSILRISLQFECVNLCMASQLGTVWLCQQAICSASELMVQNEILPSGAVVEHGITDQLSSYTLL